MGMTVVQVVEVIKAAPEEFIATVRPITVLKKFQQTDASRTHYSTILPQTTPAEEANGSKQFIIHDPASATPTDADLDDVGNYDDEDDGDAPPPLPPRTEDALILVDPPPLGSKPYPCRALHGSINEVHTFVHTDLPKPPPKLREFPPFDGSHSKTVSATGLTARMKMMKSKSQGDSIDDDSPVDGTTTSSHTRPPRYHFYEEIKPKLTYVDIDLAQNRRSKDRTAK